MNAEEIQKAIEFIAEQEARSSVKINAVAEAQNRAEERWTRTEEGICALLAIAEVHEKEIEANTQQILSLGETTKATDERLNVLISVVERRISDGRSGK